MEVSEGSEPQAGSVVEVPAKLRALGWCGAVAGLLGLGMFGGSEITQRKWGCAIVCMVGAVILAALLVVKLVYQTY